MGTILVLGLLVSSLDMTVQITVSGELFVTAIALQSLFTMPTFNVQCFSMWGC